MLFILLHTDEKLRHRVEQLNQGLRSLEAQPALDPCSGFCPLPREFLSRFPCLGFWSVTVHDHTDTCCLTQMCTHPSRTP